MQENGSVPTPTPTPTPPTPAPTNPQTNLSVPLRINVGGSQYTDAAGTTWKADMNFSGGSIDSQAAGKNIAKTTIPTIYQDERWGAFSYALPLANGTYKLRLHFAEIYDQCKAAGCRVFNVSTEGTPWLKNYDIAGKAGSMTAQVEEQTVSVTDGALNIALTGVTGSAQLAGIEVLAGDPPQTPTPAPQPSPGTAGLQATYFGTKDLSGAGKSRTDSTLNFAWGSGSPMTGIPTNQFSARWTGYLAAPTSETYTLYLTGDDGVRMWIDGKQVINGWADQSSKEYKTSLAFTQGSLHSITVEYYENYGDATAKLAWSTPTITKQVIPATAFRTTKASQGFASTYFALKGTNQLDAVLSRTTDDFLQFASTNGSFHTNLPADRFGAEWKGVLTPASTTKYTFTTESDDGVRVWVNNRLIIDRWNDHAPQIDTADMDLEAGKAYPVTVQYYENYGDATMRFLWAMPGQTATPVGGAYVTHEN